MSLTNEHEVTKQHMDALKALSDTNLKVSEARNTLTKLQETETEYLVSREKKAVEKVQKVLELSHNLVEETNKNYEYLESLARTIHDGGKFLSEAQEKFHALIEAKDEHYKLWERDIKNQEETIASLMKGLKIKETEIESGKKQIELGNRKVQEEVIRMKDERGTLDRAIIRLKDKRI